MPHTWDVSAEDLQRWAMEYGAAAQLPRVVRRLLLATAPLASIEMRADAGVRHGDWDGVVMARYGTTFCPHGLSVWELTTTDTKNLSSKLDEDFDKRTAAPGPDIDPQQTTYVAVSARRYSSKQAWVRKMRERGAWHDVKLYDADDLATWLETAPSVAAWFAAGELRYPVTGLSDVESFLARWSARTEPPLPPSVMLAGRQRQATEVQRWLDEHATQSRSAPLTIRADSREEALAFVAAVLDAEAPERREQWLARTAVVEDQGAWRWAIGRQRAEPLLLLPDFEGFDRGVAGEYSGPCVLALGKEVGTGEVFTPPAGLRLDFVPRPDMARALVDAGMSELDADRLASRAGGSLAALQQLCGYERRPPWVERSPRAPLLAMLMAGSWRPGNQPDRAVLDALGSDADSVESLCAQLAATSEAPVEYIQGTWRWRSPDAAWKTLAPELTEARAGRLVDVAATVLGTPDPRYDLPPSERWPATAHSKVPTHSSELREGLASALARLAVAPDPRCAGGNGAAWAEAAVMRIFGQSGPAADRAPDDWKRWASLNEMLPTLAEAAPSAFLDAVDDSLGHGDQGVARLLSEVHDRVWHHTPHTGLMLALKTLAWCRDYLSRVLDILAEMAERDPGGNFYPRPATCLEALLHPFGPRSLTSPEQRHAHLERLLHRHPEAGWRLGVDLLRRMDGGVLPRSPRPRYRGWKIPPDEELWVTKGDDIRDAFDDIMSLLLTAANGLPGRWAELLQYHGFVGAPFATIVLDRLEAASGDINDRDGKLWEALRYAIDRHYYDGANNDNEHDPDALLQRIRALYEAFTPTDPILRVAWLFTGRHILPEPVSHDWQQREARFDELRHEALAEVLEEDAAPWERLQRLLAAVEDPRTLGRALARSTMADEAEKHLRAAWGSPAYAELSPAFFAERATVHGLPWLEAILRELLASDHVDTAAQVAARATSKPDLWDIVDALGHPLRRAYWQTLGYVPNTETLAERHRVVSSFLDAGNVNKALAAATFPHPSTTTLVQEHPALGIQVLDAVANGVKSGTLVPDAVRRHEVSKLLAAVRSATANEEDRDRIAMLEITFLINGFSIRPVVLYEMLSTSPTLFASLVGHMYDRDTHGEDTSPDEDEREARGNQVRAAYRILHEWRGYPGEELATQPEERERRLLDWARAALDETAKAGRFIGGAIAVAEVLARAPGAPDDGIWPCRAARVLLEERARPQLARYLATAKRNLRGVTGRRLDTGGSPERVLAAEFRHGATIVNDAWPRTAALLLDMAERYDEDARQMDEVVRRDGLAVHEPAPEPTDTETTEASAPAQPRSLTGEDFAARDDTGADMPDDPESEPYVIYELERLHVEHVGPAPCIDLMLKPRLNLLTGDNSAGKTFVLDMLWWALTGSWPEHPAWPRDLGAPGYAPSISIDPQAAVRSRFDRREQRWSIPPGWPPADAVIVYVRVDGSVGVCDPTEAAGIDAGLVLSPQEIMYGKAVDDPGKPTGKRRVCEGLIADWTDWAARKPALFERFASVFENLAPDGESMAPGPSKRLVRGDAIEYPHIRFPYGEVPIIHASAAVRRVLSLAYLLVWLWDLHEDGVERDAMPPVNHLILLIDEVEAHLHPRWQRVLLPSLLEVADKLSDSLAVQIVASTHAPLVTASLEPRFDSKRDALFHFGIKDGEVEVEHQPWELRGDASAWLTSPTFDLEEARSVEAEAILRRAWTAVAEEPLDAAKMEQLTDELARVFPETDRFWGRWLHYLDRARRQA
ncbi:AAA family ATPase [Haliangium sp.]|uniref:AAA family ATPase n=1 Tax=Haliangium sp. TaxID=2663208 RepID=UPI003D0B387E